MKTILANLIIYRSNIQTIHWKIHGNNFIPIHEFTDKMYADINEFIDRVVEKYIQKDIQINTTLKNSLAIGSILEVNDFSIEVNTGINKLIKDSESILKQVEKAYSNIKELGSMDLILDDMRDYLEKAIWFLRKSI